MLTFLLVCQKTGTRGTACCPGEEVAQREFGEACVAIFLPFLHLVSSSLIRALDMHGHVQLRHLTLCNAMHACMFILRYAQRPRRELGNAQSGDLTERESQETL